MLLDLGFLDMSFLVVMLEGNGFLVKGNLVRCKLKGALKGGRNFDVLPY